MNSILMVCRGNICRSPMAEGFFLNKLKSQNIEVTSAGITALVDYAADLNAQTVMQKYGVDISQHKARQLSETLVRKAHLILVMSKSHLNTVINQFRTARGKTFLLGHWGNFEVEDPYTQPYEAFEQVYEKIEKSWQDWKTRIL